jgi:hypothetical protein
MQFLYDKIPKFRQECRPKCRPIPKDYKTAETDTETDISADTDTDNFRSLLVAHVLSQNPHCTLSGVLWILFPFLYLNLIKRSLT